MEPVLVLFFSKKDLKQTYCIYYGGYEEADAELNIIMNSTDQREVGRQKIPLDLADAILDRMNEIQKA